MASKGISMGKLKMLALGAVCAVLIAPAAAARPLALDDLYRLRDVEDVQMAPAGDWAAYTVSSVDADADKNVTHIWMSRYDGSQSLQLTNGDGESEDHPRFSPDGRYLAFLSSRTDKSDNDQLWLLDREGGEARKITDVKGGVTDFAWSPDGKRIALIVKDTDAADAKAKTARPIVIDRYFYMTDITGYLTHRRDHLYLLDVANGKTDQLTYGDFDDTLPAWSPDGRIIAFVSKRGPDADRTKNWDIYLIAAETGAKERQLTHYPDQDNAPGDQDTGSYPAWSPDGKSIAYLRSGDPKLLEYAANRLAVIPAAGGEPTILTDALDRNVTNPVWSDDGKSLSFMVEDDGTVYLARMPARGGKVERIAGAESTIYSFSGAHGHYAVAMTEPTKPNEIYAVDGGAAPRQISRQNAWLKDVTLAPVERFSTRSKDGTEVHGFLVKPPGVTHGNLPAILRLHGGPYLQYQMEFDFTWQILAAHGYAVVASNPRGSVGRGTAYSAALFADWGGPAVPDVLAAADYAVAKGVADPNRMCVGGWSYGGMLTNYVIASTTRFKCATSGASISNITAGFGTDEYALDYEKELGTPWGNTATWMKNSYPFFHADRIKTPTLFLGGTADMNVPLHNGEQMYEALKSLGIETKLVIYPGQFHELDVPSYEKDSYQRYLDWYDAHLRGKSK
jgi:dipeptidyl aminopeptidase/acylaminoacyl peptidase